MFEAATRGLRLDIKSYGAEVNLFVDHSQIVQLECLRSGNLGHEKSLGPDPNIQRLNGVRRTLREFPFLGGATDRSPTVTHRIGKAQKQYESGPETART